ncbi:DNA-binding response regulator [Paenibacillus selenitireducens]|uniref:DNA-binding response regulator n=2 Tax=Paenibacillus selenitireducens TaxID=1324314 RepID=A0A1T2X0A3_9BACL|nr:response regulator transcription factor [Paenibacillus selenitireducens]OPA73282.1 DNA-binding response regulator [Paenibacillus selenitireducens]
MNILVVDDEVEITELISLYLKREGFHVQIAHRSEDALQIAAESELDLIILDILLEDMNGIEVCKEIRKHSMVPIIFLSCKSEDNDVILGLTVGGDDYISKPFSPSQLVARVKAQLRRNRFPYINRERQPQQLLSFPHLEIDLSSRSVRQQDRVVSLSTKEFDLLVYLAQTPNTVVKIDHLFQHIWGSESFGDTRTLMVHISNLRKKIEPDPANPTYVITVRGVGYKFNSEIS